MRRGVRSSAADTVAGGRTRVGASRRAVAPSRPAIGLGPGERALRRCSSISSVAPAPYERVLAQAPCLVFWIVIRQTSSGAGGGPRAARVDVWRIDNGVC